MVLGLIAGFIGSKIVNKSGARVVLNIIQGIVGGYVFTMFGCLRCKQTASTCIAF